MKASAVIGPTPGTDIRCQHAFFILRQSASLLVQDRDLAGHVRKRVKQGADRDIEYVLLVAGHSHSLIERLGADPLRYLDPEGPQQATDLAVKLALDPNQLIPRPQ